MARHRRRIVQRIPCTLLLCHLIAEAACLGIVVFCSPLKGTPQWVITLALLLAVLVIPMSAWHVITESGD